VEAIGLISGTLSFFGNPILGIWCCIWGSDRRKAARLLFGWALVTAFVIPFLFIAFGAEPVLSGGYVILWTYNVVGLGLFVYFLRMVLASDHIRNS